MFWDILISIKLYVIIVVDVKYFKLGYWMVKFEGTDVLQFQVFGQKILEISSPHSPLRWKLFRFHICVSVHLVCYVALGQDTQD